MRRWVQGIENRPTMSLVMSHQVVGIQLFPARDAKVAAVTVRVRGERGWEHLMAWNLGSGELTHGAWTTKRLRRRYTRLSPCGRFFLYTAQDGGKSWHPATRERVFAAEDGGGTAISRLPWLAALTRVHCRGMYASPIAGKHTLSAAEEAALFAKFEGLAYHEAFPHQPGWESVDADLLPPEALPQNRSARRAVSRFQAACIAPAGREVMLVGAWRQSRGEKPAKMQWTLVAQTPDKTITKGLDVSSAWMSPATGRLLTAEPTGIITLFQPPKIGRGEAGPDIRLKVVARHDLSTLEPKPERPPAKAFVPLSASELG